MTPKLLTMMHIQPPIAGDEALLQLARARLQEAGLGGELYPGSLEHLDALLPLRPEPQPCTAHLPRDIDLLGTGGQNAVLAFAERAAGKLYGLVVHDQRAFDGRLQEVAAAFRTLDQRLGEIEGSPLLFVEYAAGLEPDYFALLFEETRELIRVGPCIDIGHVAIFSCRNRFAERFDGQDVCGLRPDTDDLPERIEGVQDAVRQTLPTVVDLIGRLAALGKPIHFHLHDGHPLSTLSPFGVSDHLSFLQQIPIPFPYRGRQLLDGIFGPEGLNRVIATTMSGLPADKLSFMLEVHPQPGHKPLDRYAHLFEQWTDKTNAEWMNYWLDRLIENGTLLRNACHSG
jgi:hypothetical protein